MATDEEVMLCDMAVDATKQAIPRTNEFLARLITLSSSLAGGSLAFMTDALCHPAGRVVAALLFAASAAAALTGIKPYRSVVPSDQPDSIREEVEKVLRWKWRCVWAAGGLLVGGLLVAVVGAVARVFVPLSIPGVSS